MESYTLSRCLCHGCTFEQIKKVAAEHDLCTAGQLQEKNICGCGCGLCIPYIEMVLETGQTEFEPGAIRKDTG